jgi:tellurite resistance protein
MLRSGMVKRNPHDAEPLARLLALVVASNGRVDPRELSMLDQLDAFARLGVSRTRVVGLAQDCVREDGVAPPAAGGPWSLGELLDAVSDPAQQLLVCRLAAAVVTADGCVTLDERVVYTRMLARWGISEAMVTRAILSDRPA